MLILGAALVGAWPVQAGDVAPYPWLSTPAASTVEGRIDTPKGFGRLPAPSGGFAAWLRGLPIKSGRPPVRLFNGSLKSNQEAHHVVLDVDVGKRDRQQCADAVMWLRAEYLHQADRDSEVCFRFTDGTPARSSRARGWACP